MATSVSDPASSIISTRLDELEAENKKLKEMLVNSSNSQDDFTSRRIYELESVNKQLQTNVFKLSEMLELEKKKKAGVSISTSPIKPEEDLFTSTPNPPVQSQESADLHQKLILLDQRISAMQSEDSKFKQSMSMIVDSHTELLQFTKELKPVLQQFKGQQQSRPPPIHVQTQGPSSINNETPLTNQEDAPLAAGLLGMIESEKPTVNNSSYDLLNLVVSLAS
jgi:small-conductance mechanosensitive channel